MENGKAKQLLDRIQDIVGEGQNVPFAAGKVLVNKEEVLEIVEELKTTIDLELKAYGQQLSYMTYDFNMDHDLDIKPIAKSEAHFNKWIVNYPFYSNIHKEGVVLYGAA